MPSAPPIFATPPSQTFNGVGNFVPAVKAPARATKPKKKAKAKRKKKVRKGKRKGKHAVRRGVALKRIDKTGVERGK